MKMTTNKEKVLNTKNDRRSFLKKTLYKAPSVILLGSLIKPTKAKAGFGDSPSDPDTE